MVEIVISEVLAPDAGEIFTVQRAAYAAEAQLYGDPRLPALTETFEQLRAELAAGPALKAMVGTRIVGAVRARLERRALRIARLIVVPDLQGHGIGTQLLRAIETRAGFAAAELDEFTLFTGHLSEANLRLYRREGYHETHRERPSPAVELVHLLKPAAYDPPPDHCLRRSGGARACAEPGGLGFGG